MWVNGATDLSATGHTVRILFKYMFIKKQYRVFLIAYSVISVGTYLEDIDGITVYNANVIAGLYILLYFGTCYNLIENISIVSMQPVL